MARKKLVVIDGYSLLFRAFYGTRYLSTSDGRPTNALFGFVSMLYTLFEREKPDSIVVAFDAPGKTFRDHEYAEYKATRAAIPPELTSQLQTARDLIAALGIPSIELTGYEADDVIGTITLDAEKRGYDTTIVTGDLDALQLVDKSVKVMTTRTGVSDVVYYDPEAVVQRYGFAPERLPDYKAFVGDPSDNIPGVPGVGGKTATKLIEQFGTVEELLRRRNELDPKMRAKIEPHFEQLSKSKWLATIARDVPVKFDYEPFRVGAREYDDAVRMLETLEFRAHTKRLPVVLKPYMDGGAQPDLFVTSVESEKPAVAAKAARSYEELLRWVGNRRAAVAEFEDKAAVAIGLEAREIARPMVERLIADRVSDLIFHHAKPLLRRNQVYEMPAFDTMLAAYVAQSGRSGYLLEDVAQGYLDEPPPVSVAERASAAYRLVEPLTERLKLEEQWRVYSEIELPLMPILAEMENVGIAVEPKGLGEFSKQLTTSIERSARLIHEMAGEEFNIGSTQQLGRILYEKLCLPAGKKTKTGYATGAEVLLQLAAEHDICREILNWRELTKLKSTYADVLPKLIREDGRIHTTFGQHVAATGRLSSIDPNLQNIPIRTELGREIRRAFVAAKGYDLASLDYSQVELRLLAHISKDDILVDAFSTGKDVHAATASLMWNEPAESVSKEHRRYAKMLNYAVLYGVTDFGLANQLGGAFTIAEAKALIKDYFERFPKVRNYVQSTIEEARSKGYTTTLVGRRRYFPDIFAGNRVARLYAERQAINAPLQGGSADMIKLAMIKIRPILKKRKTRMLLQVHDELVFELAPVETSLIALTRKAMETALPLDVPVDVDARVGQNWLEMREVKPEALGRRKS